MSKTALALAAIFLSVGVFSAVRAIQDPPPPPPEETPDDPTPTPSVPSPESTAAPLPNIEGPPPVAKSYKTMADFAAALKRAGLPCEDYQILEQEDPSLKEFALCDIGGDPNNRYDLYLFKNEESRNSWMGSFATADLLWLFGPNWITAVVGDPATVEERAELFQLAVGGQIAEVELTD